MRNHIRNSGSSSILGSHRWLNTEILLIDRRSIVGVQQRWRLDQSWVLLFTLHKLIRLVHDLRPIRNGGVTLIIQLFLRLSISLHFRLLNLNIPYWRLWVLHECFVLELLRVVEGVGLIRFQQVVMLFDRHNPGRFRIKFQLFVVWRVVINLFYFVWDLVLVRVIWIIF